MNLYYPISWDLTAEMKWRIIARQYKNIYIYLSFFLSLSLSLSLSISNTIIRASCARSLNIKK